MVYYIIVYLMRIIFRSHVMGGKSFVILILLIFMAGSIIVCSDQDKNIIKPPPPDPTNQRPVITGMSSSAVSISPLGIVGLYCDAYDPDGDTISYLWTCQNGNFPGSYTDWAITWQGPDASGGYIIKVIVYDGQDADSSEIGIEVR